MSGACSLPTEQLCGCCTGVMQETPQAITNRPALSADRLSRRHLLDVLRQHAGRAL